MSTLVGKPFCDYLNVSIACSGFDPAGDELSALIESEVRPLLDAMGYCEVAPGLFKFSKDGGTFKHFRRGPIGVLSASGQLLEALRYAGRFPDYLSMLSGQPHRVTTLHAAADYAVDGPRSIAAVWRRGRGGRVSLTRQRIEPQNVRRVQSINAANESTGTVYLGARGNASVWARVYDCLLYTS